MIEEALHGPFDLRTVFEHSTLRKLIGITDCKSLCDHVVSMSSPSVLDDRRTAIDIAIIRQSSSRVGLITRWVPTDRMIAGALTKDAGGPADLLPTILEVGKYQIANESLVLDRQAEERLRRQEKGSQRLADSCTGFSRPKQPNLKPPVPIDSDNLEATLESESSFTFS